MPRVVLSAPSIITKTQREFQFLGPLENYLVWSDSNIIPRSRMTSESSIAGHTLLSIPAAAAMLYLDGYVRSLDGTPGQWNNAFPEATKANIGLLNAWVDSVGPNELQEALAHASLSASSCARLIDDDVEVYVLSGVLRSHSIALEAFGKSGQAVKIDWMAIQDAIGSSVWVQPSARRSTVVLNFERSLAIGIRLFEISLFPSLSLR